MMSCITSSSSGWRSRRTAAWFSGVTCRPAPKLGTAGWVITILAVALVVLAGAAAVRIVMGIRQRER